MFRLKYIASLTFIFALACVCNIGFADDAASADPGNWPQWRGPLANGIAPDSNPPLEWSETQNVKWKVPLPGEGGATPIIWGDKVFVQTAFRPEKDGSDPKAPSGASIGARARQRMLAGKPRPYHFVLMAFDRTNGDLLWRRVAREEYPHEGHHKDNTFASNSPVTDGEYLYAYFGSHGLHAYDFEGYKVWERDFGDMQTLLNFGEGSSPALHGDTIVVNWDHQGRSFIFAIDKKTGKDIWKKRRDEGTSWATPLIVEHEGRAQVIVGGTGRTRSYDLKTGEVIWECGGLTKNVTSTPVLYRGLVYLTSGYGGKRIQAIRLGQKGDLTNSVAIQWSNKRLGSYVSSPLIYGNNLYFIDANKNIISNFETQLGDAHYTKVRLTNLKGMFASPVGAADRVYFTGRDGNFAVIEKGPRFELLAQNSLDDHFDASPAIVGDEIYLRGYKNLYCIAAP